MGNREADRLANEGRDRETCDDDASANTTTLPPPPKKKPKTSSSASSISNKTAPLDIERNCWSEGTFVIGVDEVGRGCLAGNLTVCAIALPLHSESMEGVRDSKRLTAKARESCQAILQQALAVKVASKTASEIDEAFCMPR